MHSEFADMTVASDPLLRRVPNNASFIQILAEQAAEFVVRTVIITGIETDFVPNIVIFQDMMKKLPLFRSSMAARAIKTR